MGNQVEDSKHLCEITQHKLIPQHMRSVVYQGTYWRVGGTHLLPCSYQNARLPEGKTTLRVSHIVQLLHGEPF